MLNWAYFPRSAKPGDLARDVVRAFETCHKEIDSHRHTHESNTVLAKVRPGLEVLGFAVESGKKRTEKISVPVLYGNNGQISKSFDADAHHLDGRFVLEVEAGRAVVNNQFLKDLFQACMMDEVDFLAIAVRNVYGAAGSTQQDFDKVVTFFETLYASNRMVLPLKGVLIIGY